MRLCSADLVAEILTTIIITLFYATVKESDAIEWKPHKQNIDILQAPLLNRTNTLRPHARWYTDGLGNAKHKVQSSGHNTDGSAC